MFFVGGGEEGDIFSCDFIFLSQKQVFSVLFVCLFVLCVDAFYLLCRVFATAGSTTGKRARQSQKTKQPDGMQPDGMPV